MHSSRMRTARLSGCLGAGGICIGGVFLGVCWGGGDFLGGVCLGGVHSDAQSFTLTFFYNIILFIETSSNAHSLIRTPYLN